jgi:hypothetical protein
VWFPSTSHSYFGVLPSAQPGPSVQTEQELAQGVHFYAMRKLAAQQANVDCGGLACPERSRRAAALTRVNYLQRVTKQLQVLPQRVDVLEYFVRTHHFAVQGSGNERVSLDLAVLGVGDGDTIHI